MAIGYRVESRVEITCGLSGLGQKCDIVFQAACAAAHRGHQRDDAALRARPHLAAAGLADRVDQTSGDVGQRLLLRGATAAAQAVD